MQLSRATTGGRRRGDCRGHQTNFFKTTACYLHDSIDHPKQVEWLRLLADQGTLEGVMWKRRRWRFFSLFHSKAKNRCGMYWSIKHYEKALLNTYPCILRLICIAELVFMKEWSVHTDNHSSVHWVLRVPAPPAVTLTIIDLLERARTSSPTIVIAWWSGFLSLRRSYAFRSWFL